MEIQILGKCNENVHEDFMDNQYLNGNNFDQVANLALLIATVSLVEQEEEVETLMLPVNTTFVDTLLLFQSL